MKRLRVNLAVACVAAVMGAVLTGCAVMTAMGDSPEAVKAVQGINEQDSLGQIAMYAKREEARIEAIKKLKEVSTLVRLVCGDNENKTIRLAAFDQLVALNEAERLLDCESDSHNENFAKAIAFQHPVSGANGKTQGGAIRAGEMFAFPEEWRKKSAINVYNNGVKCLNDFGKKILLNAAEPITLRTSLAAAAKAELSDDNIKALVNEVLADKRKMSIINGLVATESLHKNTIFESCRGGEDNFSVPLEGRKLLFSLLKGKDITDGLEHAMWGAVDDEKAGETDSENVQFAKWAIANAGDSKSLGDFVSSSGSSNEYAPWFIEAVKHIDDDGELEKILARDFFESDFPAVALAVAQQFKSPEMKAKYGAPTIAKSAPDAATRAKALADIFAQDHKAAYKVVFYWFLHEDKKGNLKGTDILSNLTDMKILAGILAEARKHSGDFTYETVVPGIKAAMFRIQKSKFDALPAEKQEALAASVKVRAAKLNGEGKTLVVGNYWVGMPLLGFFALEKSQEIKSVASDCDFDAAGKDVVVAKLVFNSKNVYAATGVENGDLAYLKIAEKLGLSDFKTNFTKFRRNTSSMNQISEYFGDFSNSYTGGKIYHESKNHGKGVLVTYWSESGILEIEVLQE